MSGDNSDGSKGCSEESLNVSSKKRGLYADAVQFFSPILAVGVFVGACNYNAQEQLEEADIKTKQLRQSLSVQTGSVSGESLLAAGLRGGGSSGGEAVAASLSTLTVHTERQCFDAVQGASSVSGGFAMAVCPTPDGKSISISCNAGQCERTDRKPNDLAL